MPQLDLDMENASVLSFNTLIGHYLEDCDVSIRIGKNPGPSLDNLLILTKAKKNYVETLSYASEPVKDETDAVKVQTSFPGHSRYAVGWVVFNNKSPMPTGGVMIVVAKNEPEACNTVDDAIRERYVESDGYSKPIIVSTYIKD